MDIDVPRCKVCKRSAGNSLAEEWRLQPARFRVNLVVLEHARFHLARGRPGRNGGVFCGGCGEWRSARRRGAGWGVKRAGLGGGKSCRAGKSARSGVRENEAVPSPCSPEPT